MDGYVGGVVWVRLLLQRGLGAIYLVAFLCTLFQFRPLLGERGLEPAPRFLARARFFDAPSIFHLHYSDRLLSAVAALGVALSVATVSGLSESGPLWVSVAVWLALWILYLSIVGVGQSFYGFGWESMLLEAGFFAIFLGPAKMAPSALPVLLLRWMLFRVELGAGLIKLRHDRCWRDLTCLYHHYETQPLPNPLSWWFHHLPKPAHRFSVLFSHFVQVVVPFGLFAPQPVASVAAGLCVLHQLLLVVSGNYGWLNWLTIVLGASGLSDSVLAHLAAAPPGALEPRSAAYDGALMALTGATILLSVQPVMNLFSRRQAMNRSYNPFHLVNTYGAFGRVTRERFEVVLEGTTDADAGATSAWKEYELKGKPGPTNRTPPVVAPYQLRLDWLLWFLPFSTHVAGGHVLTLGHESWFLRLVLRLLEADAPTLRLFRRDPFGGRAPTFVRARFYRYRYTTWSERRRTGAIWHRTLLGEYLRPVSLASVERLIGDE